MIFENLAPNDVQNLFSTVDDALGCTSAKQKALLADQLCLYPMPALNHAHVTICEKLAHPPIIA